MYDINLKNVKKGKGFYFIFLFAGLLFLFVMGGILVSSYTKLASLDAKTTSTKVEISEHDDDGTTMYSPTYYYEVNDREYKCSSSSSSSVYPGTSNKTVYYDSKNPSKCMSEYSKSSNNILIIFLILPMIFIAVGGINIGKVNKRIKIIKELNQKGKLVKNLPYRLESTGIAVNNVQILRPVIDYTLPSGVPVILYGDPRHDRKSADADGLVDLVIDESNPDNYFIDFEINRIGGNRPEDFYNQNQFNQPAYQTATQTSIPGQQFDQYNTMNTYNQQPNNYQYDMNNQQTTVQNQAVYPQQDTLNQYNQNQAVNYQQQPIQNQVAYQQPNTMNQYNGQQPMNNQQYPQQNQNTNNIQ